MARHALLLTTIGAALVVALMFGLDAWEIQLMPPRGSAGLWPVRILTDFGKAAFVLWFLAGMLFAVAVVAPRLRGTSRSRLLASRDAFAVCVSGRAGAAARRRAHQMDRRARPAVCRGRGQCLQLRAFRGNRGLCQFSIGSCHHQLRAGLRGFGGVAAGTDSDDRVCAADRRQPAGAFGPSSERCGCGCVDRVGRCDAGPVLVRGPPLGVRHRSGRHNHATGQLRGPPKGLPGALSPHKKRSP